MTCQFCNSPEQPRKCKEQMFTSFECWSTLPDACPDLAASQRSTLCFTREINQLRGFCKSLSTRIENLESK